MQAAINYIRKELHSLYSQSEIQSITYLLLEKITGLTRLSLLVNKNTIISPEQRKELESFVEKLKKNMPVQYVLENADFYNLHFNVNESVLIPRPETEELIDWVRSENPLSEPLHILDIGTGSGCIAVTLKNIFHSSFVDAYDISEEALEVAAENARRNHVEIKTCLVDILNVENVPDRWDIIVSNPPYIPEREKRVMEDNVLAYEPHIALFVPDDDPLRFYRKIIIFAASHLHPKGKLYFEIHYDAGEPLVELLLSQGFSEVELRQDIAGKDRMIRAVKA